MSIDLHTPRAECRNWRPNVNSITLPGACPGHPGQIIADLHDPNSGVFIRSAVCADVGRRGCAQKYCDEMNNSPQ